MHSLSLSLSISLCRGWSDATECCISIDIVHCVLCVRVEYFTVSLLRAYLWLHFNEVNREEKHRQQQHQQRKQLKRVTNKRILAIFRILYHFVYKEANRADKNRLIFVFFVAWTRSWRFWITGCYGEVLYRGKINTYTTINISCLSFYRFPFHSLLFDWSLRFSCVFFHFRPSNYTLIRTRKLRSHWRQKRLCGQ